MAITQASLSKVSIFVLHWTGLTSDSDGVRLSLVSVTDNLRSTSHLSQFTVETREGGEPFMTDHSPPTPLLPLPDNTDSWADQTLW